MHSILYKVVTFVIFSHFTISKVLAKYLSLNTYHNGLYVRTCESIHIPLKTLFDAVTAWSLSEYPLVSLTSNKL